MKRIKLLFLMFILCFFMFSCGGSEEKKINRDLESFNQKILPNIPK